MKAVLIFILVVLPSLLLAQGNDADWHDYTPQDGSFKISYPSNWKLKTDLKDSKVVLFAEGNDTKPEAMVAFFVTPIPADEINLSMEELIEKSSNQINTLARHKVIGYELKNSGNSPGFTFEYSMGYSKKPEDQRHFLGWSVRHNGYYFTVRYFSTTSTDVKHLETGKKIINSLSFPGGLYSAPPQQPIQLAQNNSSGNAISKLTSSSNTTSAIPINADELFAFKEGLAIVRKGNAYGVINSKGEMVIPYNIYRFAHFQTELDEPEPGFQNGSCVVQSPETGLLGLIDREGKLIIPLDYLVVQPFDNEGWARVTAANYNYFYINSSGAKIPIVKKFLKTRMSTGFGDPGNVSLGAILNNKEEYKKEGMMGNLHIAQFTNNTTRAVSENGMYGYYDRSGNEVIAPQYNSAEPFNEGLACVSKNDEFGVNKYGFINIKGETVIPFMFSLPPGNFSGGLAYVEPTDKSEFDFCFINTKGELVLQQESNNITPVWSTNDVKPKFESGYFRTTLKKGRQHLRFIDTSGKDAAILYQDEDHLDGIRIEDRDNYFPLINGIQNFQYQNIIGMIRPKMAFINLKTNKVIYTPYSNLSTFDSTSGLSLFSDGQESGYMDMEGNIRLKLAPPDKW